ncbi:MAG: hypothetical protein WDO73_15750 [Ignavibacteriota bacterium]
MSTISVIAALRGASMPHLAPHDGDGRVVEQRLLARRDAGAPVDGVLRLLPEPVIGEGACSL